MSWLGTLNYYILQWFGVRLIGGGAANDQRK